MMNMNYMIDTEKEIWENILNYEGFYQISNLGNVRSLDRFITINNKLSFKKGKIMVVSENNKEYKQISLSKNNKLKTFKIHRLIALAFIPNPNNYPYVNHIDGNKKNNNIINLEWCTAQMNIKHAYDMGLMNAPKGKNSGASKLKDEDILNIFILNKEGLGHRKIAKIYNISRVAIKIVLQRKSWRHIEIPEMYLNHINTTCTIKNENIIEIFKLYKNDIKISDISKKYKVNRVTIESILNRITWKNVIIPEELINYKQKRNQFNIMNKDKVIKAFELKKEGYSFVEISEYFGVHPGTISDLIKRRSWKNVEIPEELLT